MKEKRAMNRLVVVLILLVVGVVALGYYRDWFTISTAGDQKAVDVHINVDKDKMRADEEKAEKKLNEMRGQLKEKAGEAAGKANKGSGGGNPTDKQP
jgi:cytochrome c-type biogenesis protein CcmH/NrfG